MASEYPDPDLSFPHDVLDARDITRGADPYIFKKDGMWHLLLQEHHDPSPHAHNGLYGYTLRSSAMLEALSDSTPRPLIIEGEPKGLHQVWAAEVHFDRFLYVAISDGNNATHRMHVYETTGDARGPWHYRGPLHSPDALHWAIDLTLATIQHEEKYKEYAIWSGWEQKSEEIPKEGLFETVIPQQIYVAEFISPTEIGPRHAILHPHDEWCTSIASVLEGPQTIVIDGVFKGITVTGNASWTPHYTTRALIYRGGDPLCAAAWHLGSNLLFPSGHGVGHGMLVEDANEYHYVGHRKTRNAPGWDDRVVFHSKIPRESIETFLRIE